MIALMHSSLGDRARPYLKKKKKKKKSQSGNFEKDQLLWDDSKCGACEGGVQVVQERERVDENG